MRAAEVVAVAVAHKPDVVRPRHAIARAHNEVRIDNGVDEHAVDRVVQVMEHVVVVPS